MSDCLQTWVGAEERMEGTLLPHLACPLFSSSSSPPISSVSAIPLRAVAFTSKTHCLLLQTLTPGDEGLASFLVRLRLCPSPPPHSLRHQHPQLYLPCFNRLQAPRKPDCCCCSQPEEQHQWCSGVLPDSAEQLQQQEQFHKPKLQHTSAYDDGVSEEGSDREVDLPSHPGIVETLTAKVED
ncbi:unnamed protein product [Malus baccata var. baccata]